MYENQDVYIGDFINSSKHGKGILIHCQGKRQYEGDFVNDLFGGFGLLTYNDADEKFLKYEGSFIGFNTIIKLSNSFILSISAGQFKQGMFETVHLDLDPLDLKDELDCLTMLDPP